MNDARDDTDLRERFSDLRQEEGRSLPEFVFPAERSTRRRPGSAWIAVPTAAALAVLWFAVQDGSELEVPYAIDLSSVAWVAPTDFLLETPGSDLLATVPVIGETEPLPDASATEEETDDSTS
jgi:hypothetical protein